MNKLEIKEVGEGKDKEKEEKPKFEIIEMSMKMMLVIVGFNVLLPQITAMIYNEDVALIAMLLETELDPQFYMILAALAGALGVKQLSK